MDQVTNEVNNSIPTDDFEFFLALEDVNPNALNQSTREALEREREAYSTSKQDDDAYDFDEPDSPEDYENPDWSFLEDGNSFEDDIEDSQEQEEEEVDPQEQSNEGEIEYQEYDENTPDAFDVGYETLLNLPDGRTMSIEELQAKALADDAFKAREEQLAQREEDFNARYESALQTIEVAQLETDNILDSYATWDWDYIAETDPSLFAAERRYYDKMLKRRNDLLTQAAQAKQAKEIQEKENFINQSKACVEVLKVKIPEWSQKLYETLMEHAINEFDVDPEEVLKWNKPHQFLMVYRDYKRTKGKTMANVSLKNAKRSTARHISSNGGTPNKSYVDRQAIAAKYAAGKMSQEEAFKFLED
ncbi:hypothetical protein OGA32_000112 [Salmonella enterica]|nr:hypothetical protein [Salmonella enterica]